ncbi:hypothetical protein BGX21_005509 [Mortierella sp. AD011]|nr:hypothetical protein BGX20_007123 [Mortierella sp. AD010]KAF9403302.1 hypothetical protein BGX21_005509 [Mortierella sp. AD011]
MGVRSPSLACSPTTTLHASDQDSPDRCLTKQLYMPSNMQACFLKGTSQLKRTDSDAQSHSGFGHPPTRSRPEILNCIRQPVTRSGSQGQIGYGSRTDPIHKPRVGSGLALSWIRSKWIHVRSTDPTQPAGLTRWIRILFINPTEPPDRIRIEVKSGQI